ncbi:hypothetical protein Tco_0034893, partial [Tanacetum coccineum]
HNLRDVREAVTKVMAITEIMKAVTEIMGGSLQRPWLLTSSALTRSCLTQSA